MCVRKSPTLYRRSPGRWMPRASSTLSIGEKWSDGRETITRAFLSLNAEQSTLTSLQERLKCCRGLSHFPLGLDGEMVDQTSSNTFCGTAISSDWNQPYWGWSK